MAGSGPVRLRASRRIDADPASTALLLAGPAARELWPGAAGPVTASPPRRTPTAFVTRFSWAEPDLLDATGVLTLSYAPGGRGTPGTLADLVLEVPGHDDRAALAGLLEEFLANLAQVAHDRRSAA